MNWNRTALEQRAATYFSRKFGIPGLAEERLIDLKSGIQAYAAADARVRIFGQLLGVYEELDSLSQVMIKVISVRGEKQKKIIFLNFYFPPYFIPLFCSKIHMTISNIGLI